MDGLDQNGPATGGDREPEFQTVSAAAVDALLAPAVEWSPPGGLLQTAPGAPPDQEHEPEHEPEPAPGPRGPGVHDELSQEWRAWRTAALAQLDLAAVYGAWLTGGHRPGWYECRDALNSRHGDQHPSAAVADGSAQAERGTFYSFITGDSLSVFDFLIAQGQAATFVEAARLVAHAAGVPLPTFAPEREEPVGGSAVADKQVIVVNNRQPIDVIHDAWQALTAENHRPTLYRRSSQVVRIRKTERGEMHIAALSADDMAGMLYRVARWARCRPQGEQAAAGKPRLQAAWSDTAPPAYIARDMLNFADESLPALDALARAPLFGAAGQLIATTGFYPDDRLVLIVDAGLSVPAVPATPAGTEVEQARNLLLNELLVDFRFKSDADRAHALAALLLPFVRRLIDGPTPLHLVESPSPGSGKGLFCSAVTLIATGEDCPARVLSRYDDEIRKMLTAELSRARPVVLLDNINTDHGHQLDSPALASALTSVVWTDRVLNETRMVDLPNQALWLLTANNPRLSLELARRSLRVRIVPGQDRPWLRQQFRYPRLKEWIRAQRGRLIGAVLTLVRHWQVLGSPAGSQRLGSFERWSEVIGGILEAAGITGLLGNLDEVYTEVDSEAEPWREFVEVWWERHGSQEVRVGQLNGLCLLEELLAGLRGDGSPRSQETKLGHALAARQERVFGQLRLVKVARARGSWFALRPVEEGGAAARATAPAEPAAEVHTRPATAAGGAEAALTRALARKSAPSGLV